MGLCISKEWNLIVIDLQQKNGSNKEIISNIDQKSSDITSKTQTAQ